MRAGSPRCERLPARRWRSGSTPTAPGSPRAARPPVARCGGISATLSAAAQARAAGYEVYLASTLDGPLGIAAALHAAAVIRPARACGLATLGLFGGRADPL